MQIWDAMSGEVKGYYGKASGVNQIKVDLIVDPWETKFIIVGEV